MVVFPNAKINIGLNILSKRDDGYHNIESCFYPIPFCDVLEILPADQLSFTSTGIPIPGDADSNLCLKAYQLLQKDFDIPPVQIHLHKIIPIGAGLGGGSADATFTLKALNQMFNLNLTDEQLEKYASQLGSDCPFFVKNKPVIAKGTGNIFERIDVNLSGMHLQLIYLDIHVSTKKAYAGVVPKDSNQNLNADLSKNISVWKTAVKNDFEKSVFQQFQQVEEVKALLYKNGALYASMTGSGSAVFGIFDREVASLSNCVWKGQLP
ncbi:4-(cytidine 5'-diphospho)-2-C-methyl-D-erythritol kinase [Fulvivirga lutimaris]|uniref:4-(cytidine 5'-diphospho)-2-C-methyl-D-erythritol kinase n=1 Tax=Fulvivirga lutimaris TaxID=1819566 RepID=UPI0012BC9585|nr:4-(cytidine 5'-diphospho)-2-C-methyl-D-erythritol kinase [Fulvivirga lutimaris]MTI39918.1 4-(cytidine 5'-diphospho)-2-C-methyl-D-erythritol kinase [Fulvivirga lutimaris]